MFRLLRTGLSDFDAACLRCPHPRAESLTRTNRETNAYSSDRGGDLVSALTAYADGQDQPFLSYLAAHKVAVDTNTAINAAHIACYQIADGEPLSTVDAIVSQQFPAINGNEYGSSPGHGRRIALHRHARGIPTHIVGGVGQPAATSSKPAAAAAWVKILEA